ncbi:MAG TPA: MFS transporter [Aliidongia sp.]|nr:MFS transporter [Aliidongia sp.]
MSVAEKFERADRADEIVARLDRLPASRPIWRIVLLLSLGGAFEFYDIFITGYVAPGMVRDGLFTPESLGIFNALAGLGVTGTGTFVFMTFAGFYVGTLLLGAVADRFGRRAIFTASLIWYSVATLFLAFQSTGFGADLWRFVAGIGLGVELVTIGAYLAELVPREQRGRAFAVNQIVAFTAVPLVALLAWLLADASPLGLAGWRWVVLIGSAGAVIVWLIRLGLPESPRWLARQGRLGEAERITASLEAAIAAEGLVLPPPGAAVAEPGGPGGFAEICRPPLRRRTIMLSVFQFSQAIGFYGFAAWVPSVLIAKGIHVTQSLEYSFIIAIANPFGPLIGFFFADRVERKWQIVGAALCVACFGLIFAGQTESAPLILCGVLVTLANNWMSFAFHNYQAELFPTRIRARAVGFVYSWSRVSAAFAGLVISLLLARGGVEAVFLFIAGAMAMVAISIGGFGPRSTGLALEKISR